MRECNVLMSLERLNRTGAEKSGREPSLWRSTSASELPTFRTHRAQTEYRIDTRAPRDIARHHDGQTGNPTPWKRRFANRVNGAAGPGKQGPAGDCTREDSYLSSPPPGLPPGWPPPP
jgi:hypothetical protein